VPGVVREAQALMAKKWGAPSGSYARTLWGRLPRGRWVGIRGPGIVSRYPV